MVCCVCRILGGGGGISLLHIYIVLLRFEFLIWLDRFDLTLEHFFFLSFYSFPRFSMTSPRERVTTLRAAGSVNAHFRSLVGLRVRLSELIHLHDAHPQLRRMGLSLEQYENEVDVEGTPANITLALLESVEHVDE